MADAAPAAKRRRLDDADDTGSSGDSREQRRRAVMRMNAKAAQLKMQMCETIQRSAKFAESKLAVLVTDYAYEARPPADELKPIVDAMDRLEWVQRRQIGGYEKMIQEMTHNQRPPRFKPIRVRFCRFHDEPQPAAVTLYYEMPGTTRLQPILYCPTTQLNAWKPHVQYLFDWPESDEDRQVATLCAQNELVADLV